MRFIVTNITQILLKYIYQGLFSEVYAKTLEKRSRIIRLSTVLLQTLEKRLLLLKPNLYFMATIAQIENLATLADLFRFSTVQYAPKTMNRLYGSESGYTFGSFKYACERLSTILSNHGIGAGDRVAIYSTGHPNWSVAFFTATAFGRVAVPVLPDFTGNEARHVLEHSEAKVLFASERQLAKLEEEVLDSLDLVISIETLEILRDNSGNAAFANVSTPLPDSLACIIYTSGTTGSAKGVMLLHSNFMGNLRAGIHYFPLDANDVMLSILPLAHAYELSLGMLYPFSTGASVCYIPKPPTPSFLMQVMRDVRPTAMLSVPLIIEKVYKGSIVPMLKKSKFLHWMDQHMNKTLCKLVGKKMIKTFGGRLRFFGIGGAKLDVEVERFLQKARFPYHIGYGLTECAPLLCLCSYKNTVPGQIGKPVYGMELRLDNVNPATGEGEIVARGANIFPGYYKDAERTAQAFTPDGWFRTGDLACVDEKGRYGIKGRIGNMIVGASGENVYPEEIEMVAREISQIEDIIVVSRDNKLVALVKAADSLFDLAEAKTNEETREAVEKFKKTVSDYINSRVNTASQIKSVELMTKPFEKTATLKIRRFLYAKDAPTV